MGLSQEAGQQARPVHHQARQRHGRVLRGHLCHKQSNHGSTRNNKQMGESGSVCLSENLDLNAIIQIY